MLAAFAVWLLLAVSVRGVRGGDDVSSSTFFVTLGCYALFVLLMGSSRHDMAPHFPRSHFALPLRTHVLVACEFFGRLFSVAFLGTIMSVGHVLLFEGSMSFVLWPLALVLALAWIMGVSWFFGSFDSLLPTVFSFIFVVCLTEVLLVLNASGAYVLDISGDANVRLVVALSLLFPYILAYSGVAIDRNGSWSDIVSSLASKRPKLKGRLKPYKSPARAQLWYEWNRFGRFLPRCAFVAIASILCIIACTVVWTDTMSDRQIRQGIPLLALYSMCFCLPLATFLVGVLRILRDWQARGGARGSFMALRPMATGAQADGTVGAGAIAILITALLTLPAAVVIMGDSIDQLFPSSGNTFQLMGTFLIWLLVLWGLLWLGPWALASLVALACTRAILGGVTEEPGDLFEVCWPLGPLVTFVLFYAAHRRGLVGLTKIMKISVAWLVLFAFIALSFKGAAWLSFQLPWPDPWQLARWGALIMIPFISFASVPLEMQWHRHR